MGDRGGRCSLLGRFFLNGGSNYCIASGPEMSFFRLVLPDHDFLMLVLFRPSFQAGAGERVHIIALIPQRIACVLSHGSTSVRSFETTKAHANRSRIAES